MIAVIADDISGAAELAGEGLRHGLTAEVQTRLDLDSPAELIALDTDSRSCPPAEAAARAGDLARRLRPGRAEWVYKKVDSVGRGNVLAEADAVRAALGRARALLVPANPGLGRVIREGQYFIDGVPLEETAFAADPEHPAGTSEVLELLGAGGRADVAFVPPGEALGDTGIAVGGAASAADLAAWARRVDGGTLPAGAAEFFAALLAAKGCAPVAEEAGVAAPGGAATLFVCGSPAAWAGGRAEQCRARGVEVIVLPAWAGGRAAVERAAETAAGALDRRGAAMLALGAAEAAGPPAGRLATLAEAVAAAVARTPADRLFVEGGATASAVVRRMGWRRLVARRQLAPGVVAMTPAGRDRPVVTIKPGSYRWPEQIW